MDELRNRGLPKWPQMIVSGKSVTVEQAKEIIFRTDSFLVDASPTSGGNNHDFNESYRKAAGLDKIRVENGSMSWRRERKVAELIRVVHTNYVRNDWGSSCYIFGPNGWCHPDGTISFTHNVGKYPSVEHILEDWVNIAAAFPFLDVNVTLMSGEEFQDESEPVVNIRVKDGVASLAEPDLSVHDSIPTVNFEEELTNSVMAMSSRELGLPMEWYNEFAGKVKEAVKQSKKMFK